MNNEWARDRIYTVTMIGTRDGDRVVLGSTPAPTALWAATHAVSWFCAKGGVVYPCVVEATEDGKRRPKVGARMTIQSFEHGECDLPDWKSKATEIVQSIRQSIRFGHGAEVQDVIADVLADAAQLERLVAKHEAARLGAPAQHIERCPCGVPLDEQCLKCFPEGDDPTPEERRRNKLTDRELAEEAVRWSERDRVVPSGWVDAPEAVPGESVSISTRVPKAMADILREFARREQVGCQVLMKRWLDQRIREERRAILLKSSPSIVSPIACPRCAGTSWGGGTDGDPRPWCNDCGEDQPGWEGDDDDQSR